VLRRIGFRIRTQTHLELRHNNIGRAIVVTSAELLLPPTMTHADSLDLIVGSDDLRHLLERCRARDAYARLAFVEALEIAQLVGQCASLVRVVHATAPGHCRGQSAGGDAGEQVRVSERVRARDGRRAMDDLGVYSTYQREVRRENFFVPRVDLLLRFDMAIDTTRLGCRWIKWVVHEPVTNCHGYISVLYRCTRVSLSMYQ
jgi:hypothetical protein